MVSLFVILNLSCLIVAIVGNILEKFCFLKKVFRKILLLPFKNTREHIDRNKLTLEDNFFKRVPCFCPLPSITHL